MKNQSTTVTINLLNPSYKALFEKKAKQEGLSMAAQGHLLITDFIGKKPLIAGATAKDVGAYNKKTVAKGSKVVRGKTVKARTRRSGSSRRASY